MVRTLCDKHELLEKQLKVVLGRAKLHPFYWAPPVEVFPSRSRIAISAFGGLCGRCMLKCDGCPGSVWLLLLDVDWDLVVVVCPTSICLIVV